MSWHPDLSLEIAVEFRRLAPPPPWQRVEEWVWLGKLIKRRNWAAYGRWWKKTTAGKRMNRVWMKKKRAFLRGVVVGYSKCSVCGRNYERDALTRKTRTTCSRSCWSTKSNATRGAGVEFNGRRQSLRRWALEYGLSQPLLWHRLNSMGWSMKQALETPVDTRKGRRGNERKSA